MSGGGGGDFAAFQVDRGGAGKVVQFSLLAGGGGNGLAGVERVDCGTAAGGRERGVGGPGANGRDHAAGDGEVAWAAGWVKPAGKAEAQQGFGTVGNEMFGRGTRPFRLPTAGYGAGREFESKFPLSAQPGDDPDLMEWGSVASRPKRDAILQGGAQPLAFRFRTQPADYCHA